MAGGSWTLDLAAIREFAQKNFLNREHNRPGTGTWQLAQHVIALCAEVETMREIHASHVTQITRLQDEVVLQPKGREAVSHPVEKGAFSREPAALPSGEKQPQ